MDTRFFLPKHYYEDNNLEDELTGIQLIYNAMTFDYPNKNTDKIYATLPCIYEYELYKDDVEFLLKEYFKENRAMIGKKVIPLLTKDLIDEEYLYNKIDYLIAKPEYNKLMLDHCRERAKKEFKIAFRYWVEEDEIDDYLNKTF